MLRHSLKTLVYLKVRKISMSMTLSSMIWAAKGEFGLTLSCEKSLPWNCYLVRLEPSMRLLRFSSSVSTSLIWSRGREVRWATHSSVQMNIFKMSFSMLKSCVGFLMAIEQIYLSGSVILRLTLL